MISVTLQYIAKGLFFGVQNDHSVSKNNQLHPLKSLWPLPVTEWLFVQVSEESVL